MSYFAQINDKKIVEQVIAIANDVIGEPEKEFPETEPIGQDFIANVLKLPGEWLQTSYNGKFRGVYAGIGYSYDEINDVFVAPIIPPFEPPTSNG